jgi:YD repeat-containing protein
MTRKRIGVDQVARIIACLVVLALLNPAETHAQRRVFYGADGKATEPPRADSIGALMHYDSPGRVTARMRTSGTTTTTTYYSAGRKVGTITMTKSK